MAANEIITRQLERLLPSLPILSEEAVGNFTGQISLDVTGWWTRWMAPRNSSNEMTNSR